MSVRSSYTVTGMTCDHCVSAVTSEVSALPGVREVHVDLTTGRVDVVSTQELTRDAIGAAVDEAGYQLASSG
jgi:copper chaperone